MYRNVFARIQKDTHAVGFQFHITQRDHVQQSLWLWPVIGVIIFSSKDLDTDIFLKSAQFRRIKGQFIPPLHGRIEVVIEK